MSTLNETHLNWRNQFSFRQLISTINKKCKDTVLSILKDKRLFSKILRASSCLLFKLKTSFGEKVIISEVKI